MYLDQVEFPEGESTFKGRNGYATLHSCHIWSLPDGHGEPRVSLNFWSKRIGDAPPARLELSHLDFDRVLELLTSARAKLQAEGRWLP